MSRSPSSVAAWLLASVCLLASVAVAQEYGAPPKCGVVDPSHRAFTTLLTKYVDARGMVDYPGLSKDRRSLQAYLQTLRRVCPPNYASMTRDEQLAFWINAYNAYTLDLILEHYPLESIRKIGFLPNAAFRRDFIPLRALEERSDLLSLDDLEHQILRKQFTEPRIHFAVNCASMGCPPLRNEAFRAKTLDTQLEEMARRFINDGTRNRFDAKTNTLELSPIFKWFSADFEKAAGSTAKYVARYLPAPLGERVAKGEVKIVHLGYDWSLNAQNDLTASETQK